MKSFRCPEMARLHHELTLAPARLRLRHVEGIARALSLIDPERSYPYAFVCFQITGYRPRRPDDDIPLDGRRLIEDLVNLAEALTADFPLPADPAAGPLPDVEALAARFHVSPKTITRWRRRGLLACWYRGREGAPRLAFSRRAIRCFVARNLTLVRRGAAFRPMPPAERARIIARARELVATGHGSLHPITLRLAAETGRAVETLRAILRKHDRDNPGDALFDPAERPREIDEADVLYRAFMDGESIADLARRFGRTPRQVSRILTDVRTRELAETPIDYIYNESFDAPGAEEEILAPPSGEDAAASPDPRLARVPADLPAYLRALYRTPLLGPAAERHAFRRMNFLLHRAERLRRRIAADPAAARISDLDAVEAELDRARRVKQQIIRANLRLVVSIARRHLAGRRPDALFELISDGNVALIRAVEKFDYARGFRFSTYASWAIMRAYARAVPEEINHAVRFRTGHDEVLASLRDHRAPERVAEPPRTRIKATVENCLAGLEARERDVIERRFGLGAAGAGRTFRQIGQELGISKERARQIEIRALKKLRAALGPAGAELLAG